MAKTEIINLDNLVASRVHTPRVDGNPIYARVDGNMDNGEGSLGAKTEKWSNAVKKSYTSPDNIRRLYITHRAVYTHLFKPVRGVSSASLKVEKPFKVDMLEIAQNIYGQLGQPPMYRVTGTGISAVYKPWVCSNIEEIYFDWSILLSQDVMNMGKGDIYNIYGPASGQKLPVDILKDLFYTFCLKSTKDLKSRFPRLRSVGYIAQLEEIYNSEQDKSGIDSIEDLKTPWCINSSVKAALATNQATLWRVEGVPELNYARSTKPNIYVFDREVLEQHFVSLESRIRGHQRTERDKKDDTKKEKLATEANSIKGSFEKMMDNIYDVDGIEGVNKAVKISLKHSTSRDRQEVYDTLTDSGKLRYGELFGIK